VKKFPYLLLILGLVIVGLGYVKINMQKGDPMKKHSDIFPHEPVTNQENSALYAQVMAADHVFEATYKPQPSMFARNEAAVLTCMDPRLTPQEFMGFKSGDMFIIRNAGGRASDDALRSLIVGYKLLRVEEIFVIHHTDCGMQKFNKEVMNDLLRVTSAPARLVKDCEAGISSVYEKDACQWQNPENECVHQSSQLPAIDWLTIEHGLFKSVREDVEKIRNHPLIPSNIPIYGLIFNVMTGELIPVPEAMQVGRAIPLVCK